VQFRDQEEGLDRREVEHGVITDRYHCY